MSFASFTFSTSLNLLVQEYIPGKDSEEKGGGTTLVVVSLVIEIQGDSTK